MIYDIVKLGNICAMENPCVGICRNRQRHDLRLQRVDAPCLVWFEHSQLLLLGRHLQHVLGVRRPFQDSRPSKTKGKFYYE